MTSETPIKVLIGILGVDQHEVGAMTVARILRDAGMEVVYTGPWQEIPAVVNLAIQEDVDLIGVSSLATDHLIVPKLVTALNEAGLGNVAVVVGGIVPDGEETMLYDAGIAHVFHPGAGREEIVGKVSELVSAGREG